MKISIIIPVYNAEKTIQRCLQSIIKQTYIDIEILVIDDGSTDNSLSICNNIASIDNRIKVLRQKNSGPATARNTGLDNVSGDFVTFIDADDWVENTLIENYVSLLCDKVDLYICNYINEYPSQSIKHQDYNLEQTNDNALLFEIYQKQAFPFLWCKLFRYKIIKENAIRFDTQLKLSEDNIFIIQYLYYSQGIKLNNKHLYHYSRNQTNSLSTKRYDFKHYLYVTQRIQQYQQLYTKKNKHIDYIFQSMIWVYMQYALKSIKRIDISQREKYLQMIIKITQQINITPKDRLKNKILFYFFKSPIPNLFKHFIIKSGLTND